MKTSLNDVGYRSSIDDTVSKDEVSLTLRRDGGCQSEVG